jgi:hypothetical protein
MSVWNRRNLADTLISGILEQTMVNRPTRYLVPLVVGLLVGVLVAAMPATVRAAAIVGGPREEVTTITCSIGDKGETRCAVAQGRASVCSRRTGGAIRRSFRRYDYVPTPEGCTLDMEYWRKHDGQDPGVFDDVWEQIGSNGGETVFFNVGRSYAEVLALDPADRPYDRLARIFVAAELNRLNGANFPKDVGAAFEEASVFLISQEPSIEPDMAPRFRDLAEILERFVSGQDGPGACSVELEPLGAGDIGKSIVGATSEDVGRIQDLADGKGSADGVIDIVPNTADDQFILVDEAFLVDGIRKGKFSQSFGDCVGVAAGEQTTIEVGGNPELPLPTTPAMLNEARSLQVLIALNKEGGTDTVNPGAGPAGPGSTGGPPAGPAGPAVRSAAASFPSTTLPATNEASGGGAGLITVPNLVGLTQSQAASRLAAIDLRVGTATIVSDLAPDLGFGLIKVAAAQTQTGEPIVESHVPGAGEQVPPLTPVNLFLVNQATDMPEPASFLLFLAALATILLLLRLRRGGRADPSPP